MKSLEKKRKSQKYRPDNTFSLAEKINGVYCSMAFQNSRSMAEYTFSKSHVSAHKYTKLDVLVHGLGRLRQKDYPRI